jgi:RNA recognition motif-containing protein
MQVSGQPAAALASGLSWQREYDGERNSRSIVVKKIYCGNLPFNCTEDEVRTLFEQYGEVHEVSLVTDRQTGRPRGFGFVQMDDAGADEAISNLNGTELGGRTLRVDQARERSDQAPRRDRRPRW